MSTSEKRKLVAVLFTDIKGYTAMVQDNEDLALSRVNKHREVLERYTSESGGRIVTFYGDGALVIFESAVDAVSSAVKMQIDFIQEDVPVRIGLHLGDVAFKNDSVYGDGVNIASRIQAEGYPGAVLISGRLHQEISNHPEITADYIGRFKLKNVRRPVPIYAITNSGLYVPSAQRVTPELMRKSVVAILIMAVLGFTAFLLLKSGALFPPSEDLRSQRVAIRFQDFTNSTAQTNLGAMASHWINNRLSELPNADVVNYDDAMAERNVVMASASTDQRRTFSQKTGAVNVLEGTIFRQGDRLLLEAFLVNLGSGERLATFELVECETEEPMNCISSLSNRILGWWASRDDNPYSIPTYEAYNDYLNAREVWREDVDKAEIYLLRSISSDSSFIDPYFLLTELYILEEQYSERDSVIELIVDRFERLTPRQSDLLEVYDAEVAGDLIKSYEKYRTELEADPKDIFVNTGGMVQAMLNVNKPEEALELFDMIPVDSLDLRNCKYCHTRIRLAAQAHLHLAQYEDAVAVAERLPLTSTRNIELLLKTLAAKKDTQRINEIMLSLHRQPNYNMYEDFYPDVAWEFRLLAREDLVKWYCNEALSNFDTTEANAVSVECNYLLGNFNKVVNLIDRSWPLEEYKDYEYVVMYATRSYAQTGDQERIDAARNVLTELDEQTIYDYGKYLYMRGVVEAIVGNTNEAVDLLEHAYFSGTRFADYMYNGDIDLISIHGKTAYQSILQPLTYQEH